jgi:membrane protease YdiL (CAAX protease family)
MTDATIKGRKTLWAILAGLIVAVLSPILELIAGHPFPYLLPLLAGAVLIWVITKLSRRDMGIRAGRPRDHILALLYPIGAIGLITLIARLTGNLGPGPWGEGGLSELGLMFVSTWIGVLLTEEGFYRGALWGLGARAGWRPFSVLLWTSLAFLAWHIAVPIIEEEFMLPHHQIPIYYVNVLLLGFCWGLLRMGSGSVMVACTAHASWNALVYILFGYGTQTGSLGITNITTFGPERGVLGLLINGIAVTLLAIWALRRADTLHGRQGWQQKG